MLYFGKRGRVSDPFLIPLKTNPLESSLPMENESSGLVVIFLKLLIGRFLQYADEHPSEGKEYSNLVLGIVCILFRSYQNR